MLLDVTLRDGGYRNHWNFPPETAPYIVKTLSSIGIDIIEVGYLGDQESRPDALTCHPDYLFKLKEHSGNSLIAAMMRARQENAHKLLKSRSGCLDIVRVACCSPQEVDATRRIVDISNQEGIECFVNIASVTSYSHGELADIIKRLSPCESISVLYLADSRGALFPDESFELFSRIRKMWDGDLGFHGHNNLRNVTDNIEESINAGCKFIDCSINGCGLGGGNANITETINILSDLRPELKSRKDLLHDLTSQVYLPIKEELRYLYLHSGYKNLEQEWVPLIWEAYGPLSHDLLKTLSRREYKRFDEVLSKLQEIVQG